MITTRWVVNEVLPRVLGGLLGCVSAVLYFCLLYQEEDAGAARSAPVHVRNQVRIELVKTQRRLKTVHLGEAPVWMYLRAVVADADGYCWMDANDWCFPKEGDGAWIQVEIEVTGVSLTVPKDFLGRITADRQPSYYRDKGYLPVLKITERADGRR